MPQKKVSIVFIEDANGNLTEAKKCTECKKVKTLGEYRVRKEGLGGRQSICKVCQREKYDKKYNNDPKYKERKRSYRRRHPQVISDNNKRYYQNNKEYFQKYYSSEEQLEYRRNYYKHNKDYFASWYAVYIKNHPEINTIKDANRRARKKSLINTLTLQEKETIINYFDSSCCLSDEMDIHLDHFIALDTGHGGTYKGNIVPLGAYLNISKSNINPFEWIKRQDVKKIVDMDKWNKLIAYLAKENNLSTKDYVEFVNWCYTNKRTNEELESNLKTSLDLWKKSIKLKV